MRLSKDFQPVKEGLKYEVAVGCLPLYNIYIMFELDNLT